MAGLENPALLGLALAALPALYYAYTADETEKKVVGAAKTASILLLAVGAASPYYLVASQQLSEEATVTVLKDSSRSTTLMEDYSLDLEGVEVVTKTIATGNSSNLRQGILRNLRPDTPYLLVSDGQSTKPLQGLAQKFRRKNSTLHLLKPDMAQEAAVSIKGPSSTVIGAENRFTVKISSTNGTEVPEPVVTVDGEKIDVKKLEDKRYSFTEKFSTEQDHTIKASINIQDRFEANNQYFKTVEVTEKPEILVLGNRGGLKNDLEEFYDLTYRNSIPEDLSSYYAVIAKKQFKEEQLAGYITKGNGLIYTGNYRNPNELLPVEKASATAITTSTETILAVDNSGRIGSKKSSEENRNSINKVAELIIGSLKSNNKVGVVAYDSLKPKASRLPPRPISRKRSHMAAWIRNLQPEGYAPHHIGLNASLQLLDSRGKGNIILITDGDLSISGNNIIRRKSFQIAENMDANLIIIGVSAEAPVNGGKSFLKRLEQKSGGSYYDIKDILNKKGGLEIQLVGGGGVSKSPVKVIEDDHFITQGLKLSAAVSGFNAVETKPVSTELVKTANGNPYLTVWRYGLGRVAAFSAGSNDLGRISASDPELVSRTVSWAVGKPQRKEEKTFTVSDSRMGEPAKAEASYSVEGLKRQGKNLYTAELRPERTGFRSFHGEIYGYSYNTELQEVGYSRSIEKLSEATGGETFKPTQEEEIKGALEKFSNRKVKQKKPLSDYFILAAFIVFLSEIGYRKLNGRK